MADNKFMLDKISRARRAKEGDTQIDDKLLNLFHDAEKANIFGDGTKQPSFVNNNAGGLVKVVNKQENPTGDPSLARILKRGQAVIVLPDQEIDPTAFELQFQMQTILQVTGNPDEDIATGANWQAELESGLQVLIMAEDVLSDCVGWAYYDGICQAEVNITDEDMYYCGVDFDQAVSSNILKTGYSGDFRILTKETGTGDKWCTLKFNNDVLLAQATADVSSGNLTVKYISVTGGNATLEGDEITVQAIED